MAARTVERDTDDHPVATLFYHSSLGVQVVIEDYVHDSGNKVVSLVLAKFLHLFVAVVGIFAVLRISFGA